MKVCSNAFKRAAAQVGFMYGGLLGVFLPMRGHILGSPGTGRVPKTDW